MERIKPRGRLLTSSAILCGSLMLGACGGKSDSVISSPNPRLEFLASHPELGQGDNQVTLYTGQDTDFRLCRALSGQPSRDDHSNAGFTFQCEANSDTFRAYVKDDGGELAPQDQSDLCEFGGGKVYYANELRADICYLPQARG